MSKTVKLLITGHGSETDAPTVEDALDQIRDYLEVLRGVEEAVASDGTNSIVWRIVNASKNSPLSVEIEAFPKQFAVNIDHIAFLTTRETALGFAKLQSGTERPPYFSDKVLNKTQKIFERVTNGLSRSEADFGSDLPKLYLTPTVARGAMQNVHRVLKPLDRPYKEIGSFEGRFEGIQKDGHGRRIAFVKDQLTGETIKCLVAGSALPELEEHKIKEIWHNRRVQVSGKIYYKSRGKISQMDATAFRFLRSRDQLPQLDDIIDTDFTRGLSSEEYLEGLRNGDFS